MVLTPRFISHNFIAFDIADLKRKVVLLVYLLSACTNFQCQSLKFWPPFGRASKPPNKSKLSRKRYPRLYCLIQGEDDYRFSLFGMCSLIFPLRNSWRSSKLSKIL